jgi:hypothetical protein
MPLIEFERTARVNHAWCSIPVQRANGRLSYRDQLSRGLVYIHHIISYSKFVFLSLARMHLRYFRWCKIFISFCLSWFLFSLMLCLLLFGSFTTPWNLKTSFLMTWWVLNEINIKGAVSRIIDQKCLLFKVWPANLKINVISRFSYDIRFSNH